MPLEDAMLTQRSIRRVRPDPVDDAIVLRCVELALRAPTGGNGQNWEFIVVKDPAVKARLARENRRAWKLYRRLGAPARRSDRSRSRSCAQPTGTPGTSPKSPRRWCAAVLRDQPRLAAGGRYEPTTRRAVGEVAHLDRYGNRAWGTPRDDGAEL